MPTPPKPFSVLQAEGKSHRTKSELAQRKRAEEAMLSGESIRESPEVRSDAKAHKEFQRVKKLLDGIAKNDAIYENSINRYCVLLSEESSLQEEITKCKNNLVELEKNKAEFETFEAYLNIYNSISSSLLKFDKQLQEKRKMLLSLEKENAMTIASALRTIPKKPEQEKNPLLEALGGM